MERNRNILTEGLMLTLRNWPAFVWTYIFNLGISILFSIPLHAQLVAVTAHSLASQRLTGAFDVGTVVGVFSKLAKGPGPATSPSLFSTPIYVAIAFLLLPGTLLGYQTGVRTGLFKLLRAGLDYFSRFLRITLISVLIIGPTLAVMIKLQKLWAAHVDVHTVGRSAFLDEVVGVILIILVVAALRVYFDLMAVYTVQLGLLSFPIDITRKGRPERQIRRTFKPAWKTLTRNFLRMYLTFVFLMLLGLAAVVFSARIAVHSLAQPRMWPMFLVIQLGFFLLLVTCFWQRGAETALALDNPLAVPVAIVPAPAVVEESVATEFVAPPAPVIPIAGDAVDHKAGNIESAKDSFRDEDFPSSSS